MKITVSIGPGQHDSFLLREVARRASLQTVVRSWPRFQVEQWSNGKSVPSVTLSRSYDRIAWASWVLWRCLPWLGRYQTPKVWLFTLHDWLARRAIRNCDIFVGWSQVSLLSLEAARRCGTVGILEHPMVHVNAWMEAVRGEYDQWAPRASNFYNLFPRRLVRRMEREYETADHIMVLSRFAWHTFEARGVDASKLLYVPLGVDVNRFRAVGAASGRPFRVIYVGRMELLKGVHYLLQAFAELKLAGAELWLVGPFLPEMGPFFRRYRGMFRHFGQVKPDDMPQYYGACSVGVLPSLIDGFGLVILEAMACGLAVIATDHTAGPDLFENGVQGFIVPSRDTETLKDRLLFLYCHREEAAAMGALARERVVSAFTWDHYGVRLIDTYRSLISIRRADASRVS